MPDASYPDEKTCKGCQETKPLDGFPRDASKASGRASRCKDCKGQYGLQWRASHPDYAGQYAKQYRETHREQFAAYSRAWRAEHPDYHQKYRTANSKAVARPVRRLLTDEEKAANRRRWIEENRDRINEAKRQRRRDNPEEVRARERAQRSNSRRENPSQHAERSRRWYDENREKLRPVKARQQREWSRANPEKAKALARVQNHKKRVEEGSFTTAEWDALCERYEHRCVCCGQDGVKLTVDHIVPVKKGGTSWISNIQPLCWPCNRKKGSKTIDYRPVEHAALS